MTTSTHTYIAHAMRGACGLFSGVPMCRHCVALCFGPKVVGPTIADLSFPATLAALLARARLSASRGPMATTCSNVLLASLTLSPLSATLSLVFWPYHSWCAESLLVAPLGNRLPHLASHLYGVNSHSMWHLPPLVPRASTALGPRGRGDSHGAERARAYRAD